MDKVVATATGGREHQPAGRRLRLVDSGFAASPKH